MPRDWLQILQFLHVMSATYEDETRGKCFAPLQATSAMRSPHRPSHNVRSEGFLSLVPDPEPSR